MKVLKDILSESKQYYLDSKKKIEDKLLQLPKGSIKEREIGGKIYYYLQQRIGSKISHRYLGKKRPDDIIKKIKERKMLKDQLKKVTDAIKILRRAEGRKHD